MSSPQRTKLLQFSSSFQKYCIRFKLSNPSVYFVAKIFLSKIVCLWACMYNLDRYDAETSFCYHEFSSCKTANNLTRYFYALHHSSYYGFQLTDHKKGWTSIYRKIVLFSHFHFCVPLKKPCWAFWFFLFRKYFSTSIFS